MRRLLPLLASLLALALAPAAAQAFTFYEWDTATASAPTGIAASAPDSGAFKPDPRAYRHGLARAGANTAWFVAGHWWDVAGAIAAGLRGAWVARTDIAYPAALPPPAATGADLTAVAEAILARTAA